jgi:hypothetical protein
LLFVVKCFSSVFYSGCQHVHSSGGHRARDVRRPRALHVGIRAPRVSVGLPGVGPQTGSRKQNTGRLKMFLNKPPAFFCSEGARPSHAAAASSAAAGIQKSVARRGIANNQVSVGSHILVLFRSDLSGGSVLPGSLSARTSCSRRTTPNSAKRTLTSPNTTPS